MLLCRIFNVSKEERFAKSSTSKGNQVKWVTGREFVKADTMGYESIAEALVSDWLGYIEGIEYVDYYFCKIFEDGNKYLGCYSNSMLDEGSTLISLYRLLERQYSKDTLKKYLNNYKGRDLVKFIVESTIKVTGIDISEYLQKLVYLDALILNEDRHLNNIALIRDSSGAYKPSPIFDNGLSLLSDTGDYPMDGKTSKLKSKAKARPFSKDFIKQCSYFDNKPLVIDMKGFINSLEYKEVPFKEECFKRALDVLIVNCRIWEGKLWVQK